MRKERSDDMSLPIYLLPYKVDIENKLRELNFDNNDIKSLLYDFKGRKRQEEFLKYLNEKENPTFSELISLKIELRNKYDVFWGYILKKDGCDAYEVYNPEEYLKRKQ